jgi:4-amino-4-deoxy-L-arabinose transferase-like glycosyltransferase
MRKYTWLLFIILCVSAILRLWNLGSGDTLSDEGLMSFRAIGMLDFDEAADQTTPLEWFDSSTNSGQIPWWTKLSFHDHPPLVFVVQNIFMQIFGETAFAFRLPSALLGIASIYLLYLIGTYLYNEKVGLLAAAVLGLTANHITISRLGLQEAQSIFFILLTIFLFLKAGENKKYYIGVGVAIGLALLTKYTTGILLFIFLTYMVLYRMEDFRSRYLWVGALLAMLLFSPVLIYNIKLYQTVGHFDFQLSYIFGQNPDVWQVSPGKEEFLTLTDRVKVFIPNIIKFNSWVLLLLFVVSAAVLLRAVRRNAFLLITLLWFLLLIVGVIGPSMRFLALLTPFIALGIATLISTHISEVQLPNIRKLDFRNIGTVTLVSLFLLFECFYSINSQILPYPKGPEVWAWSAVRYENYNWGYKELDMWMRKKTDGKMPALAFEPTYHFIGEIHKASLTKAEQENKEPLPALFVYDKNIQSIAQLWTLDRLQIYHAWPVIPADTYIEFLKNNGEDYFKRAGFREIYFIFPTKKIPWKKTHLTDIGGKLEQVLTKSNIALYTTLENKRGDKTFRIYREELKI